MSDDIDKLVIQAYLDGELDDTDRRELERRLFESEPLRRAVAEAEAEHGQMRALLAPPPAAPARLRERILLALDEEGTAQARERRRLLRSWALPTSSVAAAAAALVFFVVQIGRDTRTEPSVAHDAVQQRMRAVASTPASTRPSHREVSASMTQYLATPVNAPRFASERVELDGWQPAQLRGRDAVALQYTVTSRSGRHQLTIHIVDARDMDLSGQQRMEAFGRVLWLDRPYGFSAVSYQDDRGIGYVFTSDMADVELIDLVASSDLVQRIGAQLR